MIDQPENNEVIGTKPELPPYITPRWVKLFGIGFIIAILLLGILLMTGEHGPGRHIPSNDHSAMTEQSE